MVENGDLGYFFIILLCGYTVNCKGVIGARAISVRSALNSALKSPVTLVGANWWGRVNKTAACVRVLLPLHLCVWDNKRKSGKWWTAALVKYQYCIIQAHFTLKDDLILALKVSSLCHLCSLTSLWFSLRLGLDPKLLAKILNMSSGRCWSSDTYNPVPGVMEGVPSANSYQGGFGTTLMAKVCRIFFAYWLVKVYIKNYLKLCCLCIGPWFGSKHCYQYPDSNSSRLFGTSDIPHHVCSWLCKQRLFIRLPIFTWRGGTVEWSWLKRCMCKTNVMNSRCSVKMHACLFWKGCYVESNMCLALKIYYFPFRL